MAVLTRAAKLDPGPTALEPTERGRTTTIPSTQLGLSDGVTLHYTSPILGVAHWASL